MGKDQQIISLDIIEPWEKGTDKSIRAEIADRSGDSYLIRLIDNHEIDGKPILYLIGTIRGDESSVGLFDQSRSGSIVMNMVYDFDLRKDNFRDYDVGSFRSNFLLGQLNF